MSSSTTYCPICKFDKFKIYPKTALDSYYYIECERCGDFKITDQCMIYQDIREKIEKIGYILSGLTREMNETGGEIPLFKTTNIEEYVKHYLVPNKNSIEGKIQKFLQRLREKTEYFGQEINLGDIETVVPLAYSKNSSELTALFTLITKKDLAKIGVLDASSPEGYFRLVNVTLSEKGWDITNSLEKKNKNSNNGFIAIWFDNTMNESINTIEQTINNLGFRAVCIKNELFPETIMEKALGEIRKSRFVIVDLTGQRVDVAFEAGFAFGLGIESIYVYDKKQHKDGLPKGFYTRHFQCHGYSGMQELSEIIKNALNARIKI